MEKVRPGPRRSPDWGLSACPPQRECGVCAVLGEKPEDLREVRDLYVQGFPLWFLAERFRVPNHSLRQHAWLRNWYRRRSVNLPSPRHLLTLLALERLKNAWHKFSPSTPDRMLKLLAQLTQGSEQEPPERVCGLTWEDWVHQDEAAGEKVLSP